jgi:hypothetical protein
VTPAVFVLVLASLAVAVLAIRRFVRSKISCTGVNPGGFESAPGRRGRPVTTTPAAKTRDYAL